MLFVDCLGINTSFQLYEKHSAGLRIVWCLCLVNLNLCSVLGVTRYLCIALRNIITFVVTK